MEEDFKSSRTKNLFSRIKYMKENFKPKTELSRGKNELLINNKT
jgi:hypothetical protein